MKAINTAKALYESGKTFVKLNKPKLLIFGGVGFMLVGTGVACYQMTKFGGFKADIKNTLDAAHEKKTVDGERNPDYGKELIKAYCNIGLKTGKFIAPVALPTTIGGACIFAGCKMFDSDVKALTRKVVVGESIFAAYRNRVVEEQGAEADNYYMYGVKEEDISEPVLNKNGEPKVDKDGVPVMKEEKRTVFYSDKCLDPHTIIFKEGNPLWTGDREHDLYRVQLEQNYLSEALKAPRAIVNGTICGYITENDIRERLGVPSSALGLTHGTVRIPEENVEYDIDFGVFGRDDRSKMIYNAFVKGQIDELPLTPRIVKTWITEDGVTHSAYIPFGEIRGILDSNFRHKDD